MPINWMWIIYMRIEPLVEIVASGYGRIRFQGCLGWLPTSRCIENGGFRVALDYVG